MIICFKNETNSTVILDLGENHIEIKSGMQIRVNSDTDRVKFNCYLNCDNYFKTAKYPDFIVLNYNFILNVFYDVRLKCDETEIKLIEKEVKGDHADTYRFFQIYGEQFEIRNCTFAVKDAEKAKSQIADYQKKDKKVSKYVRVFDVLQTIFYVGIPSAIVFFGVWYFANFLTALYVTVPTIIVGVLVGVLIKNMINKFGKKIDNLTKIKNDLYVNTDSYFEQEYIISVIKAATKSSSLY